MSSPMASPLIFDRVTALSARRIGGTPDGERHYFVVAVRHERDGSNPIDAEIRADVTDSTLVQIAGDPEEHVRASIERIGNAFPNDGFKLKNLSSHEPILIRPGL
jgi:hypothetical protein